MLVRHQRAKDYCLSICDILKPLYRFFVVQFGSRVYGHIALYGIQEITDKYKEN
jgi:hypothetical protein